ncbi:lytic murein transglycosylase B [Halorhodospira abdelmalekii]|uniref:lytic murein transglycosylase B n=1 Tax=Halorhodospira abdelmalekii TaxID=421629 RepID=UPI0019078729|nr:lytic murein transglycosylase B [Halorhodospira abdelmalekii]MBK1734024.1 lytic murein transglycosylase B [Halorhodospira abdelmalekii]
MTQQSFHAPTLVLIGALGCFLVGWAGTAAAAPDDFAERLAAFADEVAERYDLDRSATRAILAEARHDEAILERIRTPAEGLSWYRYRDIFITDARISAGVDYWQEHAELLEQVSERFAVEPEILLAILGVETYYGRHTGTHRVLDALSTLAFDYPPRGDFFRRELATFLRLANDHGFDPTTVTGSYAGAMGKPQFIASSYEAYAAPFEREAERADLFNSDGDALASIANYLARHGWQQGAPIAAPVDAKGGVWQEFTAPLNRPTRPQHEAASLAERGIELPDGLTDRSTAVNLIELSAREGRELWLTYNNFYVLTRYNHSALYAMAVFHLANAIREEHHR